MIWHLENLIGETVALNPCDAEFGYDHSHDEERQKEVDEKAAKRKERLAKKSAKGLTIHLRSSVKDFE